MIKLCISLVFCAVCFFGLTEGRALAAFGEDDDEEAHQAGLKKYGVIHNMADDRQVERVGGIYEPEGLDKYMKRKFDAVGSQIDALSSKIDQIEKKLDDLETLVKQSKT